ncbi:MAG: hypothetical protein KAT70_07740 [Thermoplasmata archaeon]|nr:hypothetical protein [Thermoplasmata archaeon]
MAWGTGSRPIDSVTIGDEPYHLIVNKNTDPLHYWGLQFVQGNWQVSADSRIVIAQTLITSIPADADPVAVLAKKLIAFNESLVEHFGGTLTETEATGFVDKMEALLKALHIMVADGSAQVG